MEVIIPFLNDTECVRIYPEVNPQIKVCGGQQGKSICQVK